MHQMNPEKSGTGPTLTRLASPMLMVGPAYSGKSELAIQTMRPDTPCTVIGTAAQVPAFLRPRINWLKNMRPPAWDTVECGHDLAAALATAFKNSDQVLVDSLSQWLGGLAADPALRQNPDAASLFLERIEEVVALIRQHGPGKRVVVVSGEMGGGVPPSDPVERLLREMCGLANRRAAAASATVLQVTCGIPVIIRQQP